MGTITAVTELLVGLACLALAWAMRARRGLRLVVGIVLAVAGLVAVVNAVVTLVG